ncbi:MAG: 6,7-dimethyl-8-ribityllumazine synthase [Hadesarchaea archaeon]|nr:6,7-dimethyl-8-ribityllumazine synthase [Hadesarchaea archaeon]TDA29852.1 MAG: 6,7-dimethyl-8-ribityllumazine synthase [Hadesarchaea archaeon]
MVKLGLVASEFSWDVVGPMVEFAKRHAEFLGAELVREVLVPGVWEIPVAVKKLLSEGKVDAVVTLGAVIEGETEHDEVIMQHTTRKLMDLALEYGKPVALGISGPGMTRLQALDRVNEYARRAVESAVKTARKLGIG